MNWDAIGAVAELLGAIGVILSLLYLAAQIRQNSRATRVETERYLNEAWNTVQADLGNDERTAEIVNRGFENYQALAGAEKGVFHSRVSRVLNHQYTQRRMVASGGDPKFVEGIDRVAASILNTPGGNQWWSEVGPFFVHYSEVQEYMPNLLLVSIRDYFSYLEQFF